MQLSQDFRADIKAHRTLGWAFSDFSEGTVWAFPSRRENSDSLLSDVYFDATSHLEHRLKKHRKQPGVLRDMQYSKGCVSFLHRESLQRVIGTTVCSYLRRRAYWQMPVDEMHSPASRHDYVPCLHWSSRDIQVPHHQSHLVLQTRGGLSVVR